MENRRPKARLPGGGPAFFIRKQGERIAGLRPAPGFLKPLAGARFIFWVGKRSRAVAGLFRGPPTGPDLETFFLEIFSDWIFAHHVRSLPLGGKVARRSRTLRGDRVPNGAEEHRRTGGRGLGNGFLQGKASEEYVFAGSCSVKNPARENPFDGKCPNPGPYKGRFPKRMPAAGLYPKKWSDRAGYPKPEWGVQRGETLPSGVLSSISHMRNGGRRQAPPPGRCAPRPVQRQGL